MLYVFLFTCFFSAAHFVAASISPFSHLRYKIFMFFFQRNWSALVFISRSSSFSVIQTLISSRKKESAFVVVFISKRPGSYAIYRGCLKCKISSRLIWRGGRTCGCTPYQQGYHEHEHAKIVEHILIHFQPTRWNLLCFFNICGPFPSQNKKNWKCLLTSTNVPALCLDFDEVNAILQALHIRALLSRSSREMKFDSSSWCVKAGLLRFCYDHVRGFFCKLHILLNHEYIRQDQRAK